MKKLNKLIILLITFCNLNINAQIVPNYVPTSGLVGWWPFTGNANDLSGNGNNGTNNGATLTTDRFANTNSSYIFNNNYIITSFTGIGQNFGRAFSLWTNGTDGSLLAYGGQNDLPCPPDGDAFQIIKTGNLIEINVDCSSWVYLIPNYSFNTWYHFVFSFPNNINNLNGVQVYCNSNLLNVNSTQGNGAFSTILDLPVNFGRCHRGNIYYNGKIDDIGIWNRALNECEIKQLYNATVLPTPTVSASTSNSVICIGGSAILTASTTATTYTWNTSATTMSISVSPTVTSTYTVSVSNASACVNTSTVMVTVDACTGINEVIANPFSIYPNPNNGVFTIELNETTQVIITNVLGNILLKSTFDTGTQILDIKNNVNGIYFLQLNQNGKQRTIKLIKE